jgi:hypothetical protein
MPRAFFPHTLNDVTHAVDGALGLVVADMPDRSIWVLKRNRKTAGYEVTHYADMQRSKVLSTEAIATRESALSVFWATVADE